MGEKLIDFPSGTYRTGSDHGGGNMEARVAKLEAHVEHIDTTLSDIKSDIRDIRNGMWSHLRWSIGTTITLFGILAAMMAKGFHWF